MNLVNSRNKLREQFEKGEKPFSPVLKDYRENRNSEDWRSSLIAETLCEYILYLESEIDKLKEDKNQKPL